MSPRLIRVPQQHPQQQLRICSHLNMPLLLVVIVLLFLSLAVERVQGWGTIGHEMVANIAYDRLTNRTRQTVVKILLGDNSTNPTNGTYDAGSPLADVADWADRVSYKSRDGLDWMDDDGDGGDDGMKDLTVPLYCTTVSNPRHDDIFVGEILLPLVSTN